MRLPMALFSYCANSMEMLVPRGHANETRSESHIRRWNVRNVPDSNAVKEKNKNGYSKCHRQGLTNNIFLYFLTTTLLSSSILLLYYVYGKKKLYIYILLRVLSHQYILLLAHSGEKNVFTTILCMYMII